MSKIYSIWNIPKVKSENPDFCKSLRKHIVYAGKTLPELCFQWNFKTSGFSPNMTIDPIELSPRALRALGTRGSTLVRLPAN